jgi:hypothetical protein
MLPNPVQQTVPAITSLRTLIVIHLEQPAHTVTPPPKTIADRAVRVWLSLCSQQQLLPILPKNKLKKKHQIAMGFNRQAIWLKQTEAIVVVSL